MPQLSVVISALNEEKTVQDVLRGVLAVFDKQRLDGEVVFLDNHSTDCTGELADELASKDRRVRVIHRRNRPDRDLGSSLREGLAAARGDWIMIMDCDLSHEPAEMMTLLAGKDKADIIVGSRFVAGGRAEMPLTRQVITRTYNFLVRKLVGVPCRDMTTGFKLYRRGVFEGLTLTNTGFGLHVEILLKAARRGATIHEVPIHYRPSGKSTLNYRHQFRYYTAPVIEALRLRLLPG